MPSTSVPLTSARAFQQPSDDFPVSRLDALPNQRWVRLTAAATVVAAINDAR